MQEQVVPFYVPQGDEIDLFEAAFADRMPVLLKGPTGCGKTRFLEYMAWRLGERSGAPMKVSTVACHEDLTAGDLLGRYLLTGGETVWVDGPLTERVRNGGICYLDELVEARKDTTVAIHPLTDHRRMLTIEKLSTTITAHPDFHLVVSFNPGYQSAMKEMKPSTRQRFMSIAFSYPQPEVEVQVITGESGLDESMSVRLVRLAQGIRSLSSADYLEGPSTRLLVYAARLISHGVAPHRACQAAISNVMSDDQETISALDELALAAFGSD